MITKMKLTRREHQTAGMVRHVVNLQGPSRQQSLAALAMQRRRQQQQLVVLGVWVVCQLGTWATISIWIIISMTIWLRHCTRIFTSSSSQATRQQAA
jgi:hypothetical protein